MSACAQIRLNVSGFGSTDPQLPAGYLQVPKRHLEIAARYFQQVADKYGESRVDLRWQRGQAQHYAHSLRSGSVLLAVPKVQTIPHLYTFLHEVGHALLTGHLDGSVPENQAEYEAADWALKTLHREGIEVPASFYREIQRAIARSVQTDRKRVVEIDPRALAFAGNPARGHRITPIRAKCSVATPPYSRNPGAPGAAFKRCVAAVEARGSAFSPRGVCAAAGRAKYGKKRFAEMAAAGRRRAARGNPADGWQVYDYYTVRSEHFKTEEQAQREADKLNARAGHQRWFPLKVGKRNVSDRALRYRANVQPPPGPKQCAFCGSKKQIQVGHVNGREEDTSPDNLIWTCRSCNVLAGNRLRKAGVGRLTVQYNPADGAKSVGQWLTAVLSMKGESDAMTVPAAVAMIRATSAAQRSRFASEIWDRRRSRGNPRVKSPQKIKRDQDYFVHPLYKGHLITEGSGSRFYVFKPPVDPAFPPPHLADHRAYSLQDAHEWIDSESKGTRRGKRNPAEAATEAFEQFHGHSPNETVTVSKQVHFHKHLAGAGQLRRLVVKGVDHQIHSIQGFKGALLAFNEQKNQLFIEGGDQSINLQDFGITKPHELETLGKVIDLDYHTEKSHLGSEGGKAVYAHRFRTTNQDGQHVTVTVARYPDLIYRVRDEQLEFSGGSYTIKAEGIDR